MFNRCLTYVSLTLQWYGSYDTQCKYFWSFCDRCLTICTRKNASRDQSPGNAKDISILSRAKNGNFSKRIEKGWVYPRSKGLFSETIRTKFWKVTTLAMLRILALGICLFEETAEMFHVKQTQGSSALQQQRTGNGDGQHDRRTAAATETGSTTAAAQQQTESPKILCVHSIFDTPLSILKSVSNRHVLI